jgi:molecular chaperone DnaK (HSP70)
MQVIAVPAHFNAAQRLATLEAGRLAGLARLQLLQGAPFSPHAHVSR